MCLFRPRRMYQHRDCLDLKLEVIKVQYADSKRIKMKVYFTNGRFRYVSQPQSVEIRRDQLCHWFEVEAVNEIDNRV